jgi:hypothetical protein
MKNVEKKQPGLYTELLSQSDVLVTHYLIQVLIEHKHEGWFREQERIFLGTTYVLLDIFSFFASIVTEEPDKDYKITVRKSCINRLSHVDKKVVSFYLIRKNTQHTHCKRTVFQYSWICDRDTQDKQIISSIYDVLQSGDSALQSITTKFTEGFDQDLVDACSPSSVD